MAEEDDETSKNPLSFLDKLLDDERDDGLGDVRFWKHMEYMNTKQIYRTSSLEYKTMKLMFCEAIFYMVFLISCTGYIIMVRSGDVYEARRQQLDYWGGCHRGSDGDRGSGGCDLDMITHKDHIADWLRDDLSPKAFTGQELVPGLVENPQLYRLHADMVKWEPRYIGDTKTDILIGSVRIRQLRVQYNRNCIILEDFENVTTDCFPPFSNATKSTFSWAPAWTPDYIKDGHFTWWPENRSEQASMIGSFGEYPGDGFAFDLPTNLTGALQRIKELTEWKWIDERSRAVIVELSTLNPNVNVLVHSRILFEILATGGVKARHDAFALKVIELSLGLMYSDRPDSFVFMILVCSLHFLLTVYVFYLISVNGLRFFTYFWSWFDLAILVTFYIMFIVNIVVMVKASVEPYLRPETIMDPEMFLPIGKVVADLEFASTVMALHGLFIWIKILKYFSLISYFQSLVRVIERSLCRLGMFSGLTGIVLLGFTFSFFITYGDGDNVFSTLAGSWVACVTAPAGGVDLSPILAKEDLLGPVLILAYVFIMLFLLWSVFMAIVVDAFSVTTFELNEARADQDSTPTWTFLLAYFYSILGFRLTGSETEDDKGDPDEQEIPLSLLPEAIQVRYMEEKQAMTAMLEDAKEEIRSAQLEKLREQGLAPAAGAMALTNDPGKTSSDDMPPGAESLDFDVGSEVLVWSEPHERWFSDGRVLAITEESVELSYYGSKKITKTFEEAVHEIKIKPEETDPRKIMVKRVQLQRMIDDQPVLRDVSGSDKAIEVMRRFRVDLNAAQDPYDAVAKLQVSVAKKLQELEDLTGGGLSFDEMETLRTVSQELHAALTDSQKECRQELLSVMQMASLLSRALVDLTLRMDAVGKNHGKLEDALKST